MSQNQTKTPMCACNSQIVWFFDGVGTIFACKNCEITFYYTVEFCPKCTKPVTEFREVNNEQ